MNASKKNAAQSNLKKVNVAGKNVPVAKLTVDQLSDIAGHELTDTLEVEQLLADLSGDLDAQIKAAVKAAPAPKAAAKKVAAPAAKTAAKAPAAPKTPKAPKVAKPRATVTPGGHARVTPEMALDVLAAMSKATDETRAATIERLTIQYNITERRVRSICAGRTWNGTTGTEKYVYTPRPSADVRAAAQAAKDAAKAEKAAEKAAAKAAKDAQHKLDVAAKDAARAAQADAILAKKGLKSLASAQIAGSSVEGLQAVTA